MFVGRGSKVRKRLLWIFAATLIFGLARVASANATDLVVNSNSDAPDAGDGSLRSAVAAAVDGDRIIFSPGDNWSRSEGNFDWAISLNSSLTKSDGFSLTIDGTSVDGRPLLINSGSSGAGGPLITSAGSISLSNIILDGASDHSENQTALSSQGAISLTNSMVSNFINTSGGRIITADGNITLINSVINNNSGDKVLVTNSDVTVISSTLTDNTSQLDGGAISANGDVTISGGSEFFGNSSHGGNGGAVYAPNGNVDVSDASFKGNTSVIVGGSEGKGGAIYANTVQTATPDTNKTITLVGNNADGYGGAIYSKGSVTLDAVYASSNNAGHDGGVIQAFGNVQINGSMTASYNNAGVAIGGSGGNGGVISASASYDTSRAPFHSVPSNVSIAGDVTAVSNTAATSGGAFDVHGSITLGSAPGNTILLSGNQAGSDGGAISAHIINERLLTEGPGGSLLFTDHVDRTTSHVVINGNATIALNTAGGNGGAISSDSTITVGTNSTNNVVFQNNISTSGNGGAVYISPAELLDSFYLCGSWYSPSVCTIYSGRLSTENKDFVNKSGSLKFKGNTAENGGAIYAGGVDLINSEFQANTAHTRTSDGSGGSGGAIYLNYNDATSTPESLSWDTIEIGRLAVVSSYFGGNSAETDGGAIYANRAGVNRVISIPIILNSTFSRNSSGQNGGTIYDNLGFNLVSDTILNSASLGFSDETHGVAVYIPADSTIARSVFNTLFVGDTTESGFSTCQLSRNSGLRLYHTIIPTGMSPCDTKIVAEGGYAVDPVTTKYPGDGIGLISTPTVGDIALGDPTNESSFRIDSQSLIYVPLQWPSVATDSTPTSYFWGLLQNLADRAQTAIYAAPIDTDSVNAAYDQVNANYDYLASKAEEDQNGAPRTGGTNFADIGASEFIYQPRFTTPVSTKDGFNVEITNLISDFPLTFFADGTGRASIDSANPALIHVTGLRPGTGSNLSVRVGTPASLLLRGLTYTSEFIGGGFGVALNESRIRGKDFSDLKGSSAQNVIEEKLFTPKTTFADLLSLIGNLDVPLTQETKDSIANNVADKIKYIPRNVNELLTQMQYSSPVKLFTQIESSADRAVSIILNLQLRDSFGSSKFERFNKAVKNSSSKNVERVFKSTFGVSLTDWLKDVGLPSLNSFLGKIIVVRPSSN